MSLHLSKGFRHEWQQRDKSIHRVLTMVVVAADDSEIKRLVRLMNLWRLGGNGEVEGHTGRPPDDRPVMRNSWYPSWWLQTMTARNHEWLCVKGKWKNVMRNKVQTWAYRISRINVLSSLPLVQKAKYPRIVMYHVGVQSMCESSSFVISNTMELSSANEPESFLRIW